MIYSHLYCKIRTVLNFETKIINLPHFEREKCLRGLELRVVLRLQRFVLIFLKFDDKVLKRNRLRESHSDVNVLVVLFVTSHGVVLTFEAVN